MSLLRTLRTLRTPFSHHHLAACRRPILRAISHTPRLRDEEEEIDLTQLLYDPRMEKFIDQMMERERETSKTMEALLTNTSPAATGQEFAEASKLHAKLSEAVATIQLWRAKKKELSDLRDLMNDPDPEMRQAAEAELAQCQTDVKEVERTLLSVISPPDEDDENNAIVEIHAGTGGQEASLFAYDLYNMYTLYARAERMKLEVIDISETESDGYKRAMMSITGLGAYGKLKMESGVHRVQRIPATDSAGRIHTSTATVVVLPQPSEVKVKIEEKDLKIETFRAGGAGGQHVNKTDSAVRITHFPTGIVVSSQGERSQHQNKAFGMKVLQARVYQYEKNKIDSARLQQRRDAIGVVSGQRQDRIRTYNFPQDRVTDHRINRRMTGMPYFMSGEGLAVLIRELQLYSATQELLHALDNFKYN